MRIATPPARAAAVTLALLFGPAAAFGQFPPAGGKAGKDPGPKPAPDEYRVILKEVQEAYKAPLEVDKDIRDELRKQYEQPTPQREAKIFREIRRLYQTTPEQEQVILRELRRAYDRPSPEQEERVFAEIRRGGQLPLGAVPADLQAGRAANLFRKLDQDRDGRLAPGEMPDTLRGQAARWDRNGDGFIDAGEYVAYYQAQVQVVSAGVAAGEIPIKLPKGVTLAAPAAPAAAAPAVVEERRPVVARAGKLPPGLPDWFTRYDADGDGQVGLYEWRRAGRPAAEFAAMDRNGDGLLEASELLRYLAEQAPVATLSKGSAADALKPPGGKVMPGGKRK